MGEPDNTDHSPLLMLMMVIMMSITMLMTKQERNYDLKKGREEKKKEFVTNDDVNC